MITTSIGKYTIKYEPQIAHATVTVNGLVVPEVVHSADGDHALSDCTEWARNQLGQTSTPLKGATIFWLKFTDGTFGSCGGNGYEDAKANAEEASGKIVESGQQLPYFANPIIWQPTHEKYGKSPAFCHKPTQCAGRGSCPQSRSCTD